MQDFRQLKVWQAAHHTTVEPYRMTRRFPKEELYGLAGQIRRRSASIAANIAEGCGRGANPDFARFLHIAMGFASELEYHLLLAHDLELLTHDEYERMGSKVTEVKRMLTSLIRKVKAEPCSTRSGGR